MLRRFSWCTSFAFLTLITTGFVFNLTPRYSRVGFAIAWGISVVAVPSLRFMVVAVAGRWRRWREPAVLVGNAHWVQRAVQTLSNTPSLGYRPVGILSRDLDVQMHLGEDIPILGEPELAPYLAEGGVHVALVSEDAVGRPPLSWLQEHFRCVVMVQEEGDLPVELVRVCNLGGILGIEFRNNLLRWHNRFTKRLLDVVLGSLGMLLAMPLIALGGLLVKLASRGPVFFTQQREGLGGRPITVWKLRTMFQDAEQRLEECLATNPALRDEWATHFKLTHDPRVIPGIGPLLRRFSVDELPQLWSVVKGEMSLVGPRPFPAYHLRHFPPAFREFRQRVRPGLTGMWQVIVRSNGSIEEQQLYDTYYIRNWSICLDFWILLQTLGVVLLHKGAY
jgi:Undecaprenyl-phosphate galactose phosphotransferase WbaP